MEKLSVKKIVELYQDKLNDKNLWIYMDRIMNKHVIYLTKQAYKHQFMKIHFVYSSFFPW